MYISILHIWYNSTYIYIYIILYFFIGKHPQYIYIPWSKPLMFCEQNHVFCFECQEEDFLYNYFFKWLDICHLYVSLGCSKLGPSQQSSPSRTWLVGVSWAQDDRCLGGNESFSTQQRRKKRCWEPQILDPWARRIIPRISGENKPNASPIQWG